MAWPLGTLFCPALMSMSLLNLGAASPIRLPKTRQKHKKLLQDSNDDAPGQVKQLKKVIEKIETGDLGLGDHHATMLIWGDDGDSLRRSMSDMRARLASGRNYQRIGVGELVP
uniref:CagE TrbE VirB component of type IV transporter system central domain-containing protein n=1 Tax=Panagrolaimus superbus TaxID=310955 RepID=A0A914YJV9_9BILA